MTILALSIEKSRKSKHFFLILQIKLLAVASGGNDAFRKDEIVACIKEMGEFSKAEFKKYILALT